MGVPIDKIRQRRRFKRSWEEPLVGDTWQSQLRIYLPDELVETARSHPTHTELGQLSHLLQKHSATMKCQFDAFAEYVAEAEREGTAQYPLYEWTKATIEDPVKKKKHLQSFSLHVNGREVYSRDEADALEADLQPLVKARICWKRVSGMPCLIGWPRTRRRGPFGRRRSDEARTQ